MGGNQHETVRKEKGRNQLPLLRLPSGEDGGHRGVKVLGSGCAKCRALEESVRSALEELGMDAAVDHVTDFSRIAAYGVMSTPALVIDGKVVSYGKALSKDEAKAVIQKARKGRE